MVPTGVEHQGRYKGQSYNNHALSGVRLAWYHILSHIADLQHHVEIKTCSVVPFLSVSHPVDSIIAIWDRFQPYGQSKIPYVRQESL